MPNTVAAFICGLAEGAKQEKSAKEMLLGGAKMALKSGIPAILEYCTNRF